MAEPWRDGDSRSNVQNFWDTYSNYIDEKREESTKTNFLWALTTLIQHLLKLHSTLNTELGKNDVIQEKATDVLMCVLMAAKNREHRFSLRYPSTAYYETLMSGPSPQGLLTCCSHLCILMRLEMVNQGTPPHELDMRMEAVLFEILLLLIWFSGKTLQDLAYEHHMKMEPGLYIDTQPSALLWDTSCKRLYKD